MVTIKKINLAAALLASVFLHNMAYADVTMKNLFLQALKEGKSEGVIADNVARMFQNATGSKEPIYVTINKIKDYSAGCGRLHVEMKQTGVKTNGQGTIDPWFDISICPNGRPPVETLQEEEKKKIATLKSCKTKLTKGGVNKDTGDLNATLTAKGCPSGGKSHWRYTGSCTPLMMSEKISVTFPISKEGNIYIPLVIPAQCLGDKNQNSWNAVITEKNGQILGDVHATLNK